MTEIYAVKSPLGEFEYFNPDIVEICEYMSEALFKDYRYTVVKVEITEVKND